MVGDDIKSQIEVTITRHLVERFANCGTGIENTYQLNVGDNTDFLNMLNQTQLPYEKTSKTAVVNNILEDPLDDEAIHTSSACKIYRILPDQPSTLFTLGKWLSTKASVMHSSDRPRSR